MCFLSTPKSGSCHILLLPWLLLLLDTGHLTLLRRRLALSRVLSWEVKVWSRVERRGYWEMGIREEWVLGDGD